MGGRLVKSYAELLWTLLLCVLSYPVDEVSADCHILY